MPVCTSPMCSDGRALVAQMWAAHRSLARDYAAFDASRFVPAMEAIQESLDDATHWYESLIPFNPACCTIATIGEQARSLTGQMLASVDAPGIPLPPAAFATDWLKAAFIGGAVLLALVYAPQIKSVWKS